MIKHDLSNRLPLPGWLFLLLIAPLALAGQDVGLGALSIVVLASAMLTLWRAGEPPILLLLVVMPWLQASILIFKGTLTGLSLYQLNRIGGDIEMATRLSLVSLLFLVAGLRLGAGAWVPGRVLEAREHAAAIDPRRWFMLYAGAWGGLLLFETVLRFVPGFTQLAIALDGCRWAFFGAMTWATFVSQDRSRQYWLAAFAMELLYGISGYFSSFKTVFIVSLLFLLASGLRMSLLRVLGLGVLLSVMLYMGVIWSAIKTPYRQAVSDGSGAQVVTLSMQDRLGVMSDMITHLRPQDMAEAVWLLTDRLSYVEYFGRVLRVVPESLPHEQGALWLDAATRPFMPRILFPGKAIVDDSARTSTYTQIDLTSTSSATSISLGWVAEAYIDFGVPGMFALALAFGLLMGRIHRGFQNLREGRGLWGMAMSASVLVSAIFIETSITKSLGGLAVTSLMAWLLLRHVLPRFAPWALWRPGTSA